MSEPQHRIAVAVCEQQMQRHSKNSHCCGLLSDHCVHKFKMVDDACTALSALKPGDKLPGGLVVVPERLLKLIELQVMPWGAGKAAMLEDITNDNLAGFNLEREIRAMLAAAAQTSEKRDDG